MKPLFSLCALVICTLIFNIRYSLFNLLHAQAVASSFVVDEPGINWGTAFPKAKNTEAAYDLFGLDTQNYRMAIYPENAPAALLTFNQNHRLTRTITLENPQRISSLRLAGYIKSGLHHFTCFTRYSHREEQQNVYLTNTDGTKMDASDPIFTYHLPNNWNSRSLTGDAASFQAPNKLYQSSNGSKIAYVDGVAPGSVNSVRRFAMTVFDEEGNLLWQKQIDRSTISEYITIVDVIVTNDGDILMLAQLQSSETFAARVNRPSISGYRCQIFRFTAGDVQDISLYLEENRVPLAGRLYISAEDSEELIITGLYQDLSTQNGTDGFYLNHINLEEQTVVSHTYPFHQLSAMAGLSSLRKTVA